MPLTVDITQKLDTVAPGPHVELLISGINANMVPNPDISDNTIWTQILGGTYPNIPAPSAAGVWTRSTASFNSTPASIRSTTTGTGSSGRLYLTPKLPGSAGQVISVSAAVRVTANDGVRRPSMKVAAFDINGVESSAGEVLWPLANSGVYVSQGGDFTLPAGTVQFQIYASVAGVAAGPTTVNWDDFSAVAQVGATNIAVYRRWAGKETPIQGGTKQTILGEQMFFTDYAIPLDVPVAYRVITTSSTGSTREQVQTSPINLGVSGMWVSSPITPDLAMLVTPDKTSLKNKSWSKDGILLSPVGRDEPVSISGHRRIAASIPMNFLTYTNLQGLALESILISTDPLMIRSSNDHNLPPLCYVSADVISVEYIDAPDGETARYSFVASLVAAPSYDVLVPSRTYGDVMDETSNYDWTTVYASYLEVVRGG